MTATGRRHISGFQMVGDVFGVEWSSEHVLTAEAVTDTVVVCFARGRLESAGVDRADIRTHLMTLLLGDLRAAQDRLLSLSCQTARERVASFLLFLSNRVGAKDGEPIAMAMGREDIADYLGAAVETICRILHDLKTDGVIEIPNRAEIVICSGSRLRAIAGANA
jgi:CRP-like cAMP-binding protein